MWFFLDKILWRLRRVPGRIHLGKQAHGRLDDGTACQNSCDEARRWDRPPVGKADCGLLSETWYRRQTHRHILLYINNNKETKKNQ